MAEDISRYAHERWLWGARTEDDVAIAYIRLALDQKDPDRALEMLLPSVRAAVSEVFRSERLKVEDRVPWDDLLSNDGTETSEHTTKTSTRPNTHSGRAYLGAAHSSSTLDDINALLKTHLWVWRTKENGRPVGGMIPWSELTLDDIEPTIEHERTVIAGHNRRIQRLQKAKALMERHEVTCFGDIPFNAEVQELVMA